ncbi:MAG: MarR family winged helix-turn-helix transcriptional regulator [Spirochaetaceae bacterium]
MSQDKELFVKSLESWYHISMHTTMKNLHIYAKDHGLSFPQMNCLFRMKKHGLCQVKDVGKIFEISNPAASQMLDKLVKMELITRKESQEDRRVKIHDLAPKGDDLIQKFMDLSKESNLLLADDFEPSEYEEVTSLLNRLTKSLNNRRNNV